MTRSFAHKLIIFYGASPGAGKSTLSSFLHQQLQCHHVPVRWIYENDLLYLEEFQEFIHAIQSGNRHLINALLEASTRLIEKHRESHAVLITDSIFPCFNWLIATGFYTPHEIEQFGQQLESLLLPLHPLVVYLDVDQKVSLKRAVAQRGQKWLADTIVGMNGYGYNQEKPLQDLNDVASYFKMTSDLSLSWLQKWQSDILILDATNHAVSELQTVLLEKLGLERMTSRIQVDTEGWSFLAGTYKLADEHAAVDKKLTVELIDGVLKVDTYWPDGCELVAEGDHLFRLQNTSHRIRFAHFQEGIPQEMTYDNQGGVYRYWRE